MMTLDRSGGRSLGRWVGTDRMRQSGQSVERDDRGAPPVFVAVARQLRIRTEIIFFQRKVGVGLGKGARACGKRSVFATPEKKRYIDFGLWVGYYVE